MSEEIPALTHTPAGGPPTITETLHVGGRVYVLVVDLDGGDIVFEIVRGDECRKGRLRYGMAVDLAGHPMPVHSTILASIRDARLTLLEGRAA